MKTLFLIRHWLQVGPLAARDRAVRLRRGAAQPPMLLPGQVRCAGAGRCWETARVSRTGWGD
ncbi:MAG: hypothetical protein FJ388_11945 [Verrucomicrobia bacterium]|nr:hypothetical protein [Verrucomicrobiota bacterium]